MSKIARRATWLELFYDLVFVIVIGKISHYLFLTPSLTGLLTFVALFFMVWWIWMGFSYYADMYERQHWVFRGVIYLSMLGIIMLSIAVEHLATRNYVPVIWGYLALRLLLWITYSVTFLQVKQDRPFLIFYVIGFLLGMLLWLVGLVSQNLWFCLVGFIVEFCTPMLAYLFAKSTPQQVSHFDERFGLFLLIVLGETIASVTFATDVSHWNLQNMAISVVSFFIAITMWRLYFTRIQEDVVYRAVNSSRIAMMRSFLFGNSHVLIAIAITLFGISLEWVIVKAPQLNALHAYTTSLVSYLAVLSVNQWAAKTLQTSSVFIKRIACILFMMIVGSLVRNPMILTFILAVSVGMLGVLEA